MSKTILTLEQIEEIETMITNRIVIFHDALIERNQIAPPSNLSRMVFSNQEIAPRPKLQIVKSKARMDAEREGGE